MARISELHYSNAYAASSGVAEFLEVSLAQGEVASDFTVTFYQANGSAGLTVNLGDPGVVMTVDTQSNENVYVISADNFNIRLTDPNGGGSNNYEAYALVETSSGTVVDFYDIGGGTQNIVAQDGPAAGAVSENLPVLVGPNQTTTTLQFNQPDPDTLTYGSVNPGDSGAICFTRGTMIETATGAKPVEKLRAGDLVLTADRAAQPLRWVGKRTVVAEGDMAPIVFATGILGNFRPLVVSPQHRVLISAATLSLLFGEEEALVAARHLVDGETVNRRHGGLVTYYHLMFDQHELIWANGALSESFLVSAHSLSMLTPAMRAEFQTLFPELLANPVVEPQPVRRTLQGYEARLLALAA
ncbi:type I secretion protein [Actibacterium mucosum KCTC 23349]|uniref:Type I secretion protein n=1 Tax=Actibacterium mucosum KCTC 23349 TaxID=1454373 RepID=A0A037ZEE9_9RHOB|nr:Hint domain-containing protein [Actibacterium mucosum]KAJ54855.1 type I secretion protein [Actibacterium mucosum KCTC 23349]